MTNIFFMVLMLTNSSESFADPSGREKIRTEIISEFQIASTVRAGKTLTIATNVPVMTNITRIFVPPGKRRDPLDRRSDSSYKPPLPPKIPKP